VSATAEALAEFGRSLGIEGLGWPPSGVLTVRFETRGTLFLEDRGDFIFVYLVREIDPAAEIGPILQKALLACHYREGLPFTVQAGLRGDSSLVFLVRLDSREVTLPALDRVLGLLTDLQERAHS